MNAKSIHFKITRPTRKGGRVRKNATSGQPEDSFNTKCLFFLNVGRGLRPPEIRIQFHMVSYCRAIKLDHYLVIVYQFGAYKLVISKQFQLIVYSCAIVGVDGIHSITGTDVLSMETKLFLYKGSLMFLHFSKTAAILRNSFLYKTNPLF